MKRSVPILLYHHVAPEREITPQGFETQLRSLLDQGHLGLSMGDLVRVALGEKELLQPSFVLTFDDGYRNNWDHAFPIIQKLRVPTIIYLVTEKIGSEGFLSWSNIEAMSGSGLVTFGSHTHTHRHFVRKDPYENLETELRQSKSILEDRLKKPCDHLAWPWGDYESEWISLVKRLGYVSAATTLAGANAPGSDPYEFRRINIRRQHVDWLASRLKWNEFALPAGAFGFFSGWDRRFKVWWNKESPYSHG